MIAAKGQRVYWQKTVRARLMWIRATTVGAAGRRSIACDGLKGDTFIQKTRVIVNIHREQARSYRGRRAIPLFRIKRRQTAVANRVLNAFGDRDGADHPPQLLALPVLAGFAVERPVQA